MRESDPVEERGGDEQDILRAAGHVVRFEGQVGEIYHSIIVACDLDYQGGGGRHSPC